MRVSFSDLHLVQTLLSVPLLVQVGALSVAHSPSKLCPKLSISLVSVFELQVVQILYSEPFSVQVAALVSVQSLNLCSDVSIIDVVTVSWQTRQ